MPHEVRICILGSKKLVLIKPYNVPDIHCPALNAFWPRPHHTQNVMMHVARTTYLADFYIGSKDCGYLAL